MAEHTPGPWVYNKNFLTIEGDGAVVATMSDVRYQAANARLIAAAPDLLATCEECIALGDSDADSGDFAQLVHLNHQMMRAAIARAKGEPAVA